MCEYLKWELNVDEVDAAMHCPPPHRPIKSQSFAVVRLALSISTQTSPPPNPSMVYMIPPYNTPSSLYSLSSLALSASPPTPPGIEDLMHRCLLNRRPVQSHSMHLWVSPQMTIWINPTKHFPRHTSHLWPTHLHSGVENSTKTNTKTINWSILTILTTGVG